MAGTAALISNNRVTIGFGVGWQKAEFNAMGVDFHTRGRRTDEMIEVMNKLWVGGVVSHHERFFQFDQIEMRPVPTRRVPLYCGGKSQAAFKRAAMLCDGYMGPGHSMNEVPQLVADLKRYRTEAGRGSEPFDIVVPILPIDVNRGVDDYKRLRDMGVTSTFLPPFDAGGVDRNRTAGLGRGSSIDDKKRMMERYAETILRMLE
jgi:alkanesulfonate monooxygenase SsuD/methylene tetrahydromethanopterin reductase-like flavin-dependent oxidoreductase (luciferase family)